MIKEIINRIDEHKSFLITSHISLEGDALGSELAFYLLLRKLKKKVFVYNQDPLPPIYRFLPCSHIIRNQGVKNDFEVGIVLDCSDSSRTGKVKDYLTNMNLIINIDHHISNTCFGDINWIDSRASSTCEMLYKLCQKLQLLDKKIALCLYTGIFTDTGGFTYANTTFRTHQVVFELLKYHLHPHKVDEELHSLCTSHDLRFIGKVLTSLNFDAQKKICWIKIKDWQDKDYDLTEIIFSILRLLKDVEVFIIFKRVARDKVRVNFRSRSFVDVNRIAKFFGGGGHKRASGTTIEDTLENTEKKVIAFVERAFL